MLITSDSAVRAERVRRLTYFSGDSPRYRWTTRWGRAKGQLAAALVAGRQPRRRAMDLLIAATAHALTARFYTRNAADLAGMEQPVEVVSV